MCGGIRRIIGGVALVIAIVPASGADERDRLTYLTFSGPVQLPGVTLAAGTYAFKLADPDGDRHVIQIFSREDAKLIATLITIPRAMADPPRESFVMFAERPAGAPPAMKAWFYPGHSLGEEFIYPRRQALAIARANREPVLSTGSDAAISEAVKAGKLTRLNEYGQPVSSDPQLTASPSFRPPGFRAAPEAETQGPSQVAASEGRPESARASAVGTAGTTVRSGRPGSATGASRTELPHTAGELTIVALFSALALAGAIGVRLLRRRTR